VKLSGNGFGDVTVRIGHEVFLLNALLGMIIKVGVRLRQHALDFANGDDRQEAQEQQEQHHEEAEGANEGPLIDPSGTVFAPRTRCHVTLQGGGDDHVTLIPHAHVHAHADEHHNPHVVAEGTIPEKLRGEYVEAEHQGVSPDGWPGETSERESGGFIRIGAVVGHEELHAVGVTDDRAREQDDLRHVVDVLRRDLQL